ncbi:hypothetical protein [Blautia sp. LMAG:75]|uniref:hypothetical protein n=1 Tax=Blautia sp. LMAG:75 TaxID=1969171 RepID=UPI0025BA2C73|nr:hypothetical protein [Blautia sp. LMAG:75]
MFLDKDNHLAKLNELYGQNCFQSVSLYCDAVWERPRFSDSFLRADGLCILSPWRLRTPRIF